MSGPASRPALQRPDWDAVAGQARRAATAPRALVSWTLGEASLRHYLVDRLVPGVRAEGFPWLVHEVDFISDGPVPPVPAAACSAPGFRQVGIRAGRPALHQALRAPGPDLAPLRLRAVRGADLDFRSNGVLLDGVGPG